MNSHDKKLLLESVSTDKRVLLENLLQLYAYDFSEFTNDDVNEHGDYGFGRLLRYYWNGKNPDPFIIRVDSNIAGLAFVRKIEKDKVQYNSIAEFFILRKYRKSGFGRNVATMIFDKFPGNWYVDVIQSNVPACLFWERVISDYTTGKYTSLTEEKQKKKVFTFNNANNPNQ